MPRPHGDYIEAAKNLFPMKELSYAIESVFILDIIGKTPNWEIVKTFDYLRSIETLLSALLITLQLLY